MSISKFIIHQMEQGRLPDVFVRAGIRHLLKQRISELERDAAEQQQSEKLEAFKKLLQKHAVTEDTEAANEQHYELPPAFFHEVLGPNLKYSSALWSDNTKTLKQAEEDMLTLSFDRAQISDGMEILELGCGWGSLTFWMAQSAPNARITAITNSQPQAEYIRETCEKRGINNITVIKEDVGKLSLDSSFDRIVSVEMFEHVRNYETLFDRINTWLKPGGKLFVHIFSHKKHPYLFEPESDEDWMAKYFFTGGTMPSHDLLPSFQGALKLENDWNVNGTHYAKTLEAWLVLMDSKKEDVRKIFETCYPPSDINLWIQRWRIFFMASAELFNFDRGREWGVSHYLFAKPVGSNDNE